jgi:hypothetical protein
MKAINKYELWDKIINELKMSKNYKPAIDDKWFNKNGIQPKFFNKNILVLSVQDTYFLKKIETEYKYTIELIGSKILNQKIKIVCKINKSDFKKIIRNNKVNYENMYIKLIKKPKETKNKTNFKKTYKFEDQAELQSYLDKSERFKQQLIKNSNIVNSSMPIKYSDKNVACFTFFDGRFFTYPKDKRKNAKVGITIPFKNGTYKTYNLYRGQIIINENGRGQLNTTHGKMLLAIIHIWQKQGCKFADKDGFFAFVKISIRELAKLLGYKKFGGTDFKYILNRIMDITRIPNLLSDGKNNFAFTFLNSITICNDTNNKEKTTLILSFNPFIAKQLYERKVLLRNPECYKIKNPIAFKLLMYYDKIIFKSNKIKKNITEIAKELQLDYKRQDNLLRDFSVAIKELNNYSIDKNSKFKIKIMKEIDSKYYIFAEKINCMIRE